MMGNDLLHGITVLPKAKTPSCVSTFPILAASGGFPNSGVSTVIIAARTCCNAQ